MSACVLVVDDDFDIRDTLADILADEGWEVACVADGCEAIEWLESHPPPGLILLDWMMPRCDGAEFRARQLRVARFAAIPVVLLTADVRKNEKTDALKADGYLGKPVDLQQLFDTVRRHCGEPAR